MKRWMSVLIVVLIAVVLLPGGLANPKVAMAASTSGDNFINESGVVESMLGTPTAWLVGTSTDLIPTSTATNTAYYYIDGSTPSPYAGNVTVRGNIMLILKDGADVTVNGTLTFESGASLSIYAQNTELSPAGKLTIDGGSNLAVDAELGPISVAGGTVTLRGQDPVLGAITVESFDQYGGRVVLQNGALSTNTNLCAMILRYDYTLHDGELSSNAAIAASGGFVVHRGSAVLTGRDEGVLAQQQFIMYGGTVTCHVESSTAIFAARGIDIRGGSLAVTSQQQSGLMAYAPITISGSAEVEARGAAYGITAMWVDSLDLEASITITGNPTIKASNTGGVGGSGMFAENGMSVSGGSVTASSVHEDATAIRALDKLSVSGGTVVASATNGIGIYTDVLAATGGSTTGRSGGNRPGIDVNGNMNVSGNGTIVLGESAQGFGIDVQNPGTTLSLTSGSPTVTGISKQSGWGVMAYNVNVSAGTLGGESQNAGGIKVIHTLTTSGGKTQGESANNGSGIIANAVAAGGGSIQGKSKGGYAVEVTTDLTAAGGVVEGTSEREAGVYVVGDLVISGGSVIGKQTDGDYQMQGIRVDGNLRASGGTVYGESETGHGISLENAVGDGLISVGGNAKVEGFSESHMSGIAAKNVTVSTGTLIGRSGESGWGLGVDETLALTGTGTVEGNSNGGHAIVVGNLQATGSGTIEAISGNGIIAFIVRGNAIVDGSTVYGECTSGDGAGFDVWGTAGLTVKSGSVTGNGASGHGVIAIHAITVSGTGRISGTGATAGVLAQDIALSGSGVLKGSSTGGYGVEVQQSLSVSDGYIEASGGSAVQNVGLYYGDTAFTVSGGGFYLAQMDGKATPKNSAGDNVYLTSVTGLPAGRYSITPLAGYANSAYPLLKERDGMVNVFLPQATNREYTFNRSGSGVYFATGVIAADHGNTLAAGQRRGTNDDGEWVTIWPRYPSDGSKPNPGTGHN